jgi:hypothetical protein
VEAGVAKEGVQIKNRRQTMFWHKRMVHLHYQSLHTLSAKNFAIGIPRLTKTLYVCIGCMDIPQKTHSRAKEVLEVIHIDTCGHTYRSRYFSTFTNDYSRET